MEVGQVLVVEDEPNIAFVVSYALRQAGLEVQTYTDPSAALSWLADRRGEGVALVLLDLWMPILDGRAFAQRVAADPALAAIPVLLMTGAVASEGQLPPTGTYRKVVQKPFDLDVLLSEVEAIIADDRETVRQTPALRSGVAH